MIKNVLSKSCLENKPANAYLLSGTRGVGKTTLARIFAKALNCEHGPTNEPCNNCNQCQKITRGMHMDVIEIDGASHTGVDDIRQLKETVNYAPMEGKYKVFIIDEAHMLSKSAFNALLKTLEEPPENVVFVMATTEVHKFPITIVSRCQHFTLHHLSEEALEKHLQNILEKENVPFEQNAINLIAKRATGSVRDSLSLLDQILALSNDSVTEQTTRIVLGLAGQELFEKLFFAISNEDCEQIINLARTLFINSIDIGFFVRELVSYWRSLFLLKQGGKNTLSALKLGENEIQFLESIAKNFSLSHLHAAWQLTLDTQKNINLSPEPAQNLEILLINLALLPKLLPIEKVEAQTIKTNTENSEKKNNTIIQEKEVFNKQNAPIKVEADLKKPVPQKTQNELIEEFNNKPNIKECLNILNAKIIRIEPTN